MNDGAEAKPETDDAHFEEAAAPPKKGTGKLKVIIIGVGVLVLAGIGAGLYFTGILVPHNPREATIELPDPAVFQDIQRITVDLKPSENRLKPFIRLLMQAELQGEPARAAFIANEPKIMDAMQSHMRTLTVEDLQGQVGTERLREDLTMIINRIITPEICIGVLYKEILIR